MTPVQLSSEQWNNINATLPDVGPICDRIRTFPCGEWIYSAELLASGRISQIRISLACFRDAADGLANARYALGQAIGVRLYFMSRSQAERDNDHCLADLRSRFYADYVPLLLRTVVEDGLNGILELFNLPKKEKHESLWKHVNEVVKKPSTIYSALTTLDHSTAYEEARRYRDDWVHNEPQKVESIFYHPRRRDYVSDSPVGRKMVLLGASQSPDYTWEDFIEMLKGAMIDVTSFLESCADEWERVYNETPLDF